MPKKKKDDITDADGQGPDDEGIEDTNALEPEVESDGCASCGGEGALVSCTSCLGEFCRACFGVKKTCETCSDLEYESSAA